MAVGSYVGDAGRLGDAAAYPEQQEIKRVREALAASGVRAFAGHFDVRDTAAIRDFIAGAEAECGPFGILVQCRGHHG